MERAYGDDAGSPQEPNDVTLSTDRLSGRKDPFWQAVPASPWDCPLAVPVYPPAPGPQPERTAALAWKVQLERARTLAEVRTGPVQRPAVEA